MKYFEEILKAEKRISKYVLKTPLLKSNYLSKLVDGNVYLKLENEQITGSFKARGALNKLLFLKEKNFNGQIITASTGNHALGVINAMKFTGIKGKIVVPDNIVNSKYEKLKNYEIDLLRYGENSLLAEIYARKLSEKEGYEFISPYNDVQIIAGQGSCGIEILNQTTEIIDNIFVTIGGGGLISGIASYVKKINPKINIFGCQPENSPEMALSIRNQKYTICDNLPTLSDGSAGGFEENSLTYDICNQYVDDYFLINENDILKNIKLIFEKEQKLIEGAASVAVSSLINNFQRFKKQNSVVVICGGNFSKFELLI